MPWPQALRAPMFNLIARKSACFPVRRSGSHWCRRCLRRASFCTSESTAAGTKRTLLFFTNLAAIVLAACGVYAFAGTGIALIRNPARLKRFSASLVVTLAVLLGIVIQLSSETLDRFTETRLEGEIAQIIREWSEGYSTEVIRLDVNHDLRLVELWIIIDVPQNVAALGDDGTAITEELRNRGLSRRVRDVLSKDYDVSFRYQTRFAVRLDLGSGQAIDAQPLPDDINDQ